MSSLSNRDQEVLTRAFKRIDRRARFEAIPRDDGDIELRLKIGKLATSTQVGPALVQAAAEDVMEFERLKNRLKRVYERLRAPKPPPRMKKIEIQKDMGRPRR